MSYGPLIGRGKEISVSIFLLVWSKFIFLTVTCYLVMTNIATYYMDKIVSLPRQSEHFVLYVSFGDIIPWQLCVYFF